jgi:hypothetical protein
MQAKFIALIDFHLTISEAEYGAIMSAVKTMIA